MDPGSQLPGALIADTAAAGEAEAAVQSEQGALREALRGDAATTFTSIV